MSILARLFGSAADRDKNQYIALLRPHVDALYRLAYRWTRNREDAEDLVQDVLVKLVDCVDEMRGVERLRPWLAKVLYRRYVDRYRQSQRSPVDYAGQGDESLFERLLAEQPDGADRIHQLELQRVLVRALAALDAEQRDVVVLHDVEGYSVQEVAEVLEIPLGTVKSRLHRARAYLKSLLEPGTF